MIFFTRMNFNENKNLFYSFNPRRVILAEAAILDPRGSTVPKRTSTIETGQLTNTCNFTSPLDYAKYHSFPSGGR